MSRSYKKTPIIKDACRKKEKKRIANKKIRNTAELGDGNNYKKAYETWNINDCVFRYSKEDAIADYNDLCNPDYYTNIYKDREICIENAAAFKEKYPTVEYYLKHFWEKYYKRK